MNALLSAVTGSSSYAPVVYIIGALFAGGVLQFLYTVVRNWKRGPIEDQELIAGSVRSDVSSLKDLLAEYRLEVELNKRQLEDYRNQLGTITLELAKAQARIGLLETQLDGARGEHRELLSELDNVKARRDQLREERDRLRTESAELNQRIKALEDATGITERLTALRPIPEEP